jgi:hypothetical protein
MESARTAFASDPLAGDEESAAARAANEGRTGSADTSRARGSVRDAPAFDPGFGLKSSASNLVRISGAVFGSTS